MRKYGGYSDKIILLLQEQFKLLLDLPIKADFFFDLNYNF